MIHFRPFLALFGGLMLASCGGFSDNLMTDLTEQQAEDHIMLVRRSPETLGHRRLAYQSGVYRDLDAFLKVHGYPDFLAETNNDGRHYMVLYYLDSANAYASRTFREAPKSIDFAGPYPITKREVRLLTELSDFGEGGVVRRPATER